MRYNPHFGGLLALAFAGALGMGGALGQTVTEKPFDGRSLFGWDGNPEIWRVENGCIVGQTTADKPISKNTFLVWQGGDLGDFDLKLEIKLEGGNSGIQYRSSLAGDDWTLHGYQADLEAGDTYSGILYEEGGRGILAQRGQKVEIGEGAKVSVTGSVGDSGEINSKIRKGEWNTYEIVARGNRFMQKINGVVTVDVTDNDAEHFKDRGLLGIQVHAGPAMKVSVKNMELRRHKMKGKKKIVFYAGNPSHGYDAHEHRAGCLLLANQLNKHLADQVYAEVHLQRDWPENFASAADADAIVFYCDGGEGHMANQRLKELDAKLADGTGLACLHYGVETTKGEPGDYFLKWIGGYFETDWSVNPHWVADYESYPQHPVAKGLEPFQLNDEWYFNMRFVPDMEGVTPLFTAVPPASTMQRRDGPHEGNPAVRKMVAEKLPQHMAWLYNRPTGGRGYGLTGGHFHRNWGHRIFRTATLNAIAWVAGAEIPENGVPSDEIDDRILDKNQDEPKP